MATQSQTNLVDSVKRGQIGNKMALFQTWKAHHMFPILVGTDATAASTKVLSVTGILATDVVIALASSAAGKINNVVPTANTITFNASAAVVPFQYAVFRPTQPTF